MPLKLAYHQNPRSVFGGFYLFTVLIVLAACTGCTRIGFSVLNAPTYNNDMAVQQDIAYGDLPEQKLDVYMPPQVAGKKRDVVVFFYGGRWETGAKADYRFAGDALVRNGFVVVIPDYRKYPDIRFPDFVRDGAKAVAWVSDHIGQYGGDATRIHLAGHSAGAHIAALLAADKRYMQAEHINRDVIKSVIGLAGPYAFTPEDEDLKNIFGPPANYPNMQVTTFIDGTEPPMLLLYGDQDTAVKQYNLDRLISAIESNHGCVRSKIYSGIDHVDLVVALSWVGRNKSGVLSDMVGFMRRTGTCNTNSASRRLELGKVARRSRGAPISPVRNYPGLSASCAAHPARQGNHPRHSNNGHGRWRRYLVMPSTPPPGFARVHWPS